MDVAIPTGADDVTVEGVQSGVDNVEVDRIGAKQ